jgi:DNA invertase Pin-like site-specific DNA recombinase
MLVGYMRVSTADQNLDLQRDALLAVGCEKVFEDVGSGALDTRKGLLECLKYVRPGDILVSWKLDRLGRSLKHLVEVMGNLEKRNVGFKSLSESIDTTTDTGRLVFHIFASLAEFERSLIRERTNAGLKAARARGRSGGRPRSMDDKKLAMAKTLIADPANSVDEICKNLKISRSTLYRSLKINTI